MNYAAMEEKLAQLPLFSYHFFDPKELDFTQRIRWICENECPMYGKSWACPPATGEVHACKSRCMQYDHCLMIVTMTEVEDIANITQALATRPEHEDITSQVEQFFLEEGIQPYILSTEACAVCDRCAYLDGQPCRLPERMHPCVESHGINVIPMFDTLGIPFISGENLVTWVSLLFFT